MSLGPQPPLPPPPVLTPPAGWLGFLGMKSNGVQPSASAAYLQPTIDMDRFYRAGSRVLLATGPVARVDNNIAIPGAPVVPPNRIWVVEYATAAMVAVAGAAANFLASMALVDVSLNVIQIGQPLSQRVLTGELAMLPSIGPFIALPGQVITVAMQSAAATTAFNWGVQVWGTEVHA